MRMEVRDCSESRGGRHVFVHYFDVPNEYVAVYACEFCQKEVRTQFDRRLLISNGEDPLFTGSVFEALGFTKNMCPTCRAHLYPSKDGEEICLNGCHLSEKSREKLDLILKGLR